MNPAPYNTFPGGAGYQLGWEYKTPQPPRFEYTTCDGAHPLDLNVYGEKGWELVTVINEGITTQRRVAYLKRLIPPVLVVGNPNGECMVDTLNGGWKS